MTVELDKRRRGYLSRISRSCGSDISDPQHPRRETETPVSSYALKILVFIPTLQLVMAAVLFIGIMTVSQYPIYICRITSARLAQ